jgi:hypothetical protein
MYTSAMDEWGKALLSAGIGFSAALLLDAAKSVAKQAVKTRRVRRALYHDLALIMVSLEDSERHYGHEHRLENTRLEVFDYYYNAEREAFYALDDGAALQIVYKRIREFTEEQDPGDAKQLLDICLSGTRMLVQTGFIDGALLSKLRDKHVKKLSNRINKSR